MAKRRVLHQLSGASKTIEDGADLAQIRSIGEQQLQGDPRLAGIQRIGGDEPASDEIDLSAWVAIGSAQRFARPCAAGKNNRNAFG